MRLSKLSAPLSAEKNGRQSLSPDTYFRLLPIGYFEGIDSERGIAWRAADSLGLRQFPRIGCDENTPDRFTISRTRRPIDLETHRKVLGMAFLACGFGYCFEAARKEKYRPECRY